MAACRKENGDCQECIFGTGQRGFGLPSLRDGESGQEASQAATQLQRHRFWGWCVMGTHSLNKPPEYWESLRNHLGLTDPSGEDSTENVQDTCMEVMAND